MKVRTSLMLAIMLAALSAAPAASQSLTGTWEISSETPRGAQTMTLELEHDGSELTGAVTLRMGGRGGGGGGPGARTIEISDGSVDGNSFSFTMTLNMRGNEIVQSFSGTFEGDEMEGTIGGPRGERPFTGQRPSGP